MAALDFPPSPLAGTTYPSPPVVGQPIYTWDGEKWTTYGGVIVNDAGPAVALPLVDATPAVVGVSGRYAREDHVHPTDTSRASLASPVFTGDPQAPTPTAGDNDTSIATTAFVTTAVAALGTPPDLSTYALINSPVFTGNPTAPTPLTGDNDASIATTAFVKTAVDAVVFSSGASIIVSDTAPVGAPDNSLWWNSSSGLLHIRYNDGTSTQWVLASK